MCNDSIQFRGYDKEVNAIMDEAAELRLKNKSGLLSKDQVKDVMQRLSEVHRKIKKRDLFYQDHFSQNPTN